MQQPQSQGDDFVTAVLLTFDPQLPPGGVKAQAQAYCDAIRLSPDGWRLCLQKLHEVALAKGSDHVKFWCLLTIHEITEKRYAAMNEEEKTVMRRSLMLFVRDIIPVIPQSSFIKNKLCAIMVKIVKSDYPKIWPTFFKSTQTHSNAMRRTALLWSYANREMIICLTSHSLSFPSLLPSFPVTSWASSRRARR